MLTEALAYHDSGLAVLPARRAQKRPALSRWKKYQDAQPKRLEVETWFANEHDGLCLLTGKVSGNLELLDFDLGAELYPAWADIVRAARPGLLERLVIERSQSGGRHVVYRCSEPVPGNAKLASRAVKTAGPGEVAIAGKNYSPRPHGEEWAAIVCLIETRGEGGLFLCAPTAGYVIEQGDFAAVPTITADERETLFEAAYQLNEWHETPQTFAGPPSVQRPGDEYNARGPVRDVLRRAGWSLWRPGDNEHWTRPGKTVGCSATLKGGTLYVFTSNAPPFEPNRAYSPFQVLSMLEYGGDFHAAAARLRIDGYGVDRSGPAVDLSMLGAEPVDLEVEELEPEEATLPALPAELLDVPGIIGDVIKYNLETAPRPQPTLALAGALCLMAVLAGRKLRDPQENRTNIYTIGLAESGHGKGHAMKINKRLLVAAGAADPNTGLEGPSRPASDAGLFGELELKPSMLCQVDEFGRHLSQMKSPHSPSFGLVTAIMELFSAADIEFHAKAYSKRANPGVKPVIIMQPCLVLHTVSALESFRNGVDASSLADGGVARMLIFETGELPDLRDVPFEPPPERLVDAVKAWYAWRKMMTPQNPPDILAVEWSDEARTMFADLGREADGLMRRRGVDWRSSVWARAGEKAKRLALVYSASRVGAGIRDGEEPFVDAEAARWACGLARHLTHRLIAICNRNVSEGQFQASHQKFMRVLETLGGSALRQRLRKALPNSLARDFDEIAGYLVDTGAIDAIDVPTKGRPAVRYQVRRKIGTQGVV